MMESLYFEYNFEHVRSIGRIIKEYKYSHVGLNKKYLKNWNFKNFIWYAHSEFSYA